MTLWRSWHLRNDIIHEKGNSPIAASVNFLDRYLQELNLNCRRASSKKGKELLSNHNSPSDAEKGTICGRVTTREIKKWTAPELGWMKINVDASFDHRMGTCSIACISRDHTGRVLWARNEAGIKCQDVTEAEAKACLLGLQSIHDRENTSIILESDCSTVVEAIKRKNQGKSRLWDLFEEIG